MIGWWRVNIGRMGGNRDMVRVECSSMDSPHGVGNHRDAYKLSLTSFQVIFNKNSLHKA